jgi:hypothetical protein
LALSRDALTEIAHDPSAGARSKLLSSISDLVFSRRQPNREEVAALCAVAKLLFRVASAAARCHFATTIAQCDLVPRDMVFLLLNDELIIAEPVLRESPVLTEEDLIACAETMGDDRLQILAQRHSIGPEVVEILLNRGGEPIHLAVSENHTAHLTENTLQILIARAETSEALCRSLVRRPEVGKSDAEHLVQLITRMLKSRMKFTPEMAADPLPDPVPDAVDVPTLSPKLSIAEILTAVKSGRLGADHAISKLALDDRFNDLTTLISGLTRIDDVSVMRLLLRADVNGIGMILKGLDVSEATFDTVVALRKRRLKTSDSQARFEREIYAKLSASESKATLRQLAGARRS